MTEKNSFSFWRKTIFFPSDHGSWVFLLSPMLAGLIIGGTFSTDTVALVIGAMAAFLVRQPLTIAIKAYAGRRSRRDLPAAHVWIVLYGSTALFALLYLVRNGFTYLLWLAIPGLLVFFWHLWLVRRREERKQLGLDIVASGALALAAPAVLWVSRGEAQTSGWWLWALFWMQSAASIVYAFVRLEQRLLDELPPVLGRLENAWRALIYTGFNLTATGILCAARQLPTWLWLPYVLQFLETVWGTFNPAIGVKPSRIGVRQLMVSTLFTLLFVAAWGW